MAPNEGPTVAQIGGCHPDRSATLAKICQDYGYKEINLNCGCPSNKVNDGYLSNKKYWSCTF